MDVYLHLSSDSSIADVRSKLYAEGRQPRGQPRHGACLQVNGPGAGELHHETLTGEEGALDAAHALNGVTEGRLPCDHVARVDDETSHPIFLSR